MSCNHDCANCTSKNSEGCFLIEPHKNSTIKKRSSFRFYKEL